VPGGLRGWCGLWGTGCAAMREPYSKTHFYTYRPTSYLDVASGRWTPRWCDEAGHAAPLGPAWSTHQASPNGLQRRAGATSDLVRPLLWQQGAYLLQRTCARSYQPPRKTSTCSGPWTELLLLFRILKKRNRGNEPVRRSRACRSNSGPISMVFWPLNVASPGFGVVRQLSYQF